MCELTTLYFERDFGVLSRKQHLTQGIIIVDHNVILLEPIRGILNVLLLYFVGESLFEFRECHLRGHTQRELSIGGKQGERDVHNSCKIVRTLSDSNLTVLLACAELLFMEKLLGISSKLS